MRNKSDEKLFIVEIKKVSPETFNFCGEYRGRTDDLLHAMQSKNLLQCFIQGSFSIIYYYL